jgi:hypothetical protein
MKFNNGLNSNNSELKRIKLKKIDAVERLDENNFSNKKKYWYNPDTGVVYDLELDYPVGRINKEFGLAKKIDATTYLIDEIIHIPKIKRT